MTGTGRCGTTTFARALSHVTNYSSGHETRAGLPWDRVAYPRRHIEVDAALAMIVPLIIEHYPLAKWVRIRRGRDDCLRSLVANESQSMTSLARMVTRIPEPAAEMGAALWYDLVMAATRQLPAFTLQLETAKIQWRECWDFMGCLGDFEASLSEWEVRYNATT